MNYCEKDFINQIQKMLASRKRRVIEHPPFSHAAVLVPLFQKDGECHLLFTKRSEEVRHHKSEISFPGGMVDEGDKELVGTALREAHEEIGLKQNDVQIIGVLDDIVTTTEFIVTPIIGFFPYPYRFNVCKAEISELIEVPLAFLLDPGCLSERETLRGDQKEIIYFYQYGNYTIWGATARILKQFLDLISPMMLYL